MSMIRNVLLGGSAIGAVMTAAVPALAAGDQAAPSTPTASTPAAPALAATTDTTSVGDIVVTAQRRSEKQRDVPISITTLSSDMMMKAGVFTTTELGKVTPAVILPLSGAFILPSIRGISSSGTGLGDNPNVAMYIDGVYQASQSAGLSDLGDVQSIQVLKGPQGSLYGQNAAGGAIIIDTMAPSFDTHGKLSVGYGNYSDKTASGYLTGGLSQTLAAIVSASFHDRDGLNLDLLTGQHDQGLRSGSVRGKLLWQPSSDVSFTLGGYWTRHNDTGVYAGVPLNGNSLGVAVANLPCAYGGLACLNLPIATQPHTFSMSQVPDTQIETYGTSLRGNIKLNDLGTITTVTAYDKSNVVDFSDVDPTPVNTDEFYFKITGHDFIQEVNFSSEKFSGFTVTTGAFFMVKHEEYQPIMNYLYPYNAEGLFDTAYPSTAGASVFGTVNSSTKRSYAAYLEGNYDITPTLTLTAAGRYSYERVNVGGTPIPPTYQVGDVIPIIPDPRGAFTFSKFTPRAVLRYKPDESNTIYASFSQGFKSGYVNVGNVNNCTPSPQCIDPPVKPEVVDAMEVGYKGRLSRSFDLNLSAFHYIYKNIQVYVYDTGESYFQNAAEGHINGAEFDATWRPVAGLSIKGAGAYLGARYSSFPDANIYTPNGFGNSLASADVSGKQLMRTPRWTFNAAVNYTVPTSIGEIGAYVGSNTTSEVYYDPQNRVGQPGYALVDAELSLTPAGIPGAKVTVWGKNLTNHAYLQSVLESQFGDSGSYADPRTYGVRFEIRF